MIPRVPSTFHPLWLCKNTQVYITFFRRQMQADGITLAELGEGIFPDVHSIFTALRGQTPCECWMWTGLPLGEWGVQKRVVRKL